MSRCQCWWIFIFFSFAAFFTSFRGAVQQCHIECYTRHSFSTQPFIFLSFGNVVDLAEMKVYATKTFDWQTFFRAFHFFYSISYSKANFSQLHHGRSFFFLAITWYWCIFLFMNVLFSRNFFYDGSVKYISTEFEWRHCSWTFNTITSIDSIC